LQIYLEADKDCANLPKDWKKIANFNLTLINQVNDRWSVRKGIFCTLIFLNFMFMLTVFVKVDSGLCLETNYIEFHDNDMLLREERFCVEELNYNLI